MTSAETSSAKKRRKRNRWVVVIQVMVMFDAFNHGDVALTDVKRRRQMTYSPLSMYRVGVFILFLLDSN
jgi:hypothetical protein